jgi:hypothetical protein
MKKLIKESAKKVKVAGKGSDMDHFPVITRVIEQVTRHAQLAVERAVAARFLLGGVRASASPDPLEIAAQELLEALSDRKLQDLRAGVERAFTAPPTDRRRRFGAVADVDLTSEKSISEQLRQTSFDQRFSEDPRRPLSVRLASFRRPKNALVEELTRLMKPAQLSFDALRFAPQELVREPRQPLFITVDVSDFLGAAPTAVPMAISHADAFLGTGALETKYIQMGGANSVLGPKVGSERIDQDWAGRLGRVQVYENGMCWTDGVHAYCIWGSIYDHWHHLDGLTVPFLGFPAMDQRRAPRDDGTFCHFKGSPDHGVGSIYHGDNERACEIHGAIRGEYASNGWEYGLGWLLSDEMSIAAPGLAFGQSGALQKASRGTMYWSWQHGAHSLPLQVNTLYESFGGPSGNLGHVVWTAPDLSVRPVNFEGGRFTITGSPARPVLDSTPRAHAFRLITVKAKKTTNEPARDEMKMSVVKIEPDGEVKGELRSIGQFLNGGVHEPNHFTQFSHDPNRTPPLTWPRDVAVSYFLVESDDGDLDAWHLSLIENIKKETESQLEDGLEGLEVALGGLGKAISAILGIGLGTVIDAVFGGIKTSLTEDTIFKPVTFSRTLETVWSGPPSQGVDEGWHVLAVETEVTKADKGEYELRAAFLRSVDA